MVTESVVLVDFTLNGLNCEYNYYNAAMRTFK